MNKSSKKIYKKPATWATNMGYYRVPRRVGGRIFIFRAFISF